MRDTVRSSESTVFEFVIRNNTPQLLSVCSVTLRHLHMNNVNFDTQWATNMVSPTLFSHHVPNTPGPGKWCEDCSTMWMCGPDGASPDSTSNTLGDEKNVFTTL